MNSFRGTLAYCCNLETFPTYKVLRLPVMTWKNNSLTVIISMVRALVKTSAKARVQPEQIKCRNQPLQSVLLPSTYDSLGVDRQMHQSSMLYTSRGSLHARSPECGCVDVGIH